MVHRRNLARQAAIVLCATLCIPALPLAHAEPAAEIRVVKGGDAQERHERNVDEVALGAQEKAIARLEGLLRKYRGSSQEPNLLSRLSDIRQQRASILFRISHGLAQKNPARKEADTARFQKAMREAIDTFTSLITRYPNFEEIPRAYYGRGKSYEELGDKAKATEDYLHLVQDFPDAPESPSAYMALAEFAIQANDHPRAVSYLQEVEKNPLSPHYPFALYKLAWSYYNLKNIQAALGFAERQVAYFNALLPKDSSRKQSTSSASANVTSDSALRDNTLMDIPVFYFEGYETKIGDYALEEALPYFRRIESGPTLGRMLTRFAKLLRSHGHEADLIAFKNQTLKSEPERPETLEVVLITYEFQLNKHRYDKLTDSAQDIVRLHRKETPEETSKKAQKLLLDTAEGLQAAILKNKTADDVDKYSKVLATIYDSFTRIVDEQDPRVPRVHYNLAETLFAIRDYPGATTHYRWVVEHGKWRKKEPAGTAASVADSSLKAIASRYEVLRSRKLIPTELSPKSLARDSDSDLDPLLGEWVEWIDTHADHETEKLESFLFESNRALYAQNHVKESIKRFRRFVKDFPKLPQAIAAASLVLDTYIATQDWENTHELATDFMKVSEWKSGDFSKRLYVIASDAFYKQMEGFHRAKEYKAAIKKADQFLKLYPQSERISDTLNIAGSSALGLQEKERAMGYFSRLIDGALPHGSATSSAAASKSAQRAPASLKPDSNVGTALLARASFAEERYRFSDAANDYKSFLTLPGSAVKIDEGKADDLRRRTLVLAWLSGNKGFLKTLLASKAICAESMQEECEKYSALSLLGVSETTQEATEDAFDRARGKSESGSKENRPLWAIVAMEGVKHLSFRDRNLTVRLAVSGWEDLDPLSRYAVLPYLTASIPKAFSLNRQAMKEVAPLRADERYITRRVEVIREMENAATKAIKLPWSRIRAEVLNEIASLYIDFARGLSELKPPKNIADAELPAYQEAIRKLTLPFEEKGQEMREKAFGIASKFAIEDEAFQRISEPFFQENPSQAKKIRPASPIEIPKKIDLALLDRLDPDGDWDDAAEAAADHSTPDASEPASVLKVLWARAIQNRQWQQVAFFMQEAKEKSLLQSGALGSVRAISLAAAGARGEALAELEDTRSHFEPKQKILATVTLMHYFLRSCERGKTQDFFKELEKAREAGEGKIPSELASLADAAKIYVQ